MTARKLAARGSLTALFVASLQSAQAGPAPVLLFLDGSSGHGGGNTTSQAIDQNASVYAFLIKNLGMPGN